MIRDPLWGLAVSLASTLVGAQLFVAVAMVGYGLGWWGQ